MSKKTGIGIIGCGNISTAYLELAPLFKSLDVRAVADIDPDVAQTRAAEFGVRAETVAGLLAADDVEMLPHPMMPMPVFLLISTS